MHPLQVVMIMSSTAMLLITALLLIVRRMPSRPGVSDWLFSALAQSIVYVVAYISYPGTLDATGLLFFYCLQTLVCRGMCAGTLRFVGKPINMKRRTGLTIVVLAGVISLSLAGFSLLASLLFAGYVAGSLLDVVYYLYKLEDKSVPLKFTMVLFALNAIHWLDYPILSQVEWFVPIGFMIGMVIVVGAFLSLCVLSLTQFKLQTEASEQRAIYAASHDPLTGLYNRSHLEQLFSEYTEEAAQSRYPFILLYFDLDGFKYVNDTYGHAAGDVILTTVSHRLTKWLGENGDAIRIGGDELVVLTRLRADFNRSGALEAAGCLLKLIEQPIVDKQNTYQVSASVGGCCYQLPHNDLSAMINEADNLMYAAKQAGGHRIHFSPFEAADPVEEASQGEGRIQALA